MLASCQASCSFHLFFLKYKSLNQLLRQTSASCLALAISHGACHLAWGLSSCMALAISLTISSFLLSYLMCFTTGWGQGLILSRIFLALIILLFKFRKFWVQLAGADFWELFTESFDRSTTWKLCRDFLKAENLARKQKLFLLIGLNPGFKSMGFGFKWVGFVLKKLMGPDGIRTVNLLGGKQWWRPQHHVGSQPDKC